MLDISAKVGSEIVYGGDTSAQITTQGGGAAANVATWLAANKEKVYLVTRVGEDLPGEFLLKELDKYGVEHSPAQIKGEITGSVILLIDKSGERTMFPDSGVNGTLALEDLPELSKFEVAYVSGYCLINAKSRINALKIMNKIREKNIPLVLDPGTVGALRNIPHAEIHSWLNLSDVLILNEAEAKHISQRDDLEAAIENLLKLTDLLVIKRGERGAFAQYKELRVSFDSVGQSKVLDTTGAGDAFAAGFISSWFRNKDLKAALEKGTEYAQKCINKVGARPPIPNSF